MAPPLPYVTPHATQQYCLPSLAARLSSTGISYHSLLPHIPSICLSAVNSSPCSGIAPQSQNSSSQLLHLLGDLCPCLGYVWLQQGLSDSHSIQAATDQLFPSQPCFSSDSDNCPNVEIGPLLHSPTNSLVFPHSSIILPSFAWVYIFFSAGQGLLSVLSWCSACTSVSEGVFLMYPWREMQSMSTYSSAILFLHHQLSSRRWGQVGKIKIWKNFLILFEN